MKESKAMVRKEVSFMKKKGAPKSMIKHEMAEAGMKKSGVKKMAMGGMGQRPPTMPGKPMPPNPVSKPPTMPGKPMPGPMPRPTSMPMTNVKPAMGMMKKGGKVKKMAAGGLAAGHKSADGVARRGKTKAEQVKMAGGGKTKKYC